jgi:multimeric flavodoxin WrbA
MKKVTAFVGSAHKRNTHKAVVQFLDHLKALGDVETEIVTLSDYRLGVCRGCRVCFEQGEALCPLKDDRDVLFDKIRASDGVIFATPNYTFQMSGIMKVFLDRFGFAFHRPRYFGKAFTSLLTQGFGGGGDIIKYFDFVANILGFNTLKGVTVTGFDPRTDKEQQKIDRALAQHSRRFHALLAKPAQPVPTFFQLMLFRMGRTTMKQQADAQSIDYQYFADQGWFTSAYYYPTQLGALKTVAGNLLDALAASLRALLA